MAIRRIKKSHVSVTGFFSSYKNQKQIDFESKLEHDFYLSLEFNEKIKSYQEQPFKIYYVYDNKKRPYTPDTLVNYTDGTQKVFEVKPKEKIDNDSELQEKIELQKQKIEDEKDLKLYVFTDADITKVCLDNMKVIYNFAFIKDNGKIQAKIRSELEFLIEPVSVSTILDELSNNKIDRLKTIPYIWNIVFRNPHCMDFKKKITMASMIDPKGLKWDD